MNLLFLYLLTCSVKSIVVGNGHGNLSSNPISQSTNTHGKGMNPIILPPVTGK